MARQTITKQTPLGSYPALPLAANSADLVWTAAIVADKEQFAPGGNDLVLVWNTDAANPYTVTFTSKADARTKRTGDLGPYTLQANEIAAFGPFKQDGWQQTDGKVYMEANNAAIKYAVIAVP